MIMIDYEIGAGNGSIGLGVYSQRWLWLVTI